MKKISKLLLLFAALIFCCGTLRASEVDKRPVPDIYWFYITVKIDNDKKIEILDSDTKVTKGSPKSFTKATRKGITNHQVAIGPFLSEAEANNAKIYYKKSKNEITEQPQESAPELMHWFQIALIEKRTSVYKFIRVPFAVKSGSANEFVNDLFDDLKYERIEIGLYWDYTQAEEAKALSRHATLHDGKLKHFLF